MRVGKTLAVSLLLGLVVRLIFVLVIWVDRPLTVDQLDYLMLADNLSTGQGLRYDDGELRLLRSPGYPVFLAAIFLVSHSTTLVKIVQCTLGTLTVLLIAAMGKRVGGSRVGSVAAVLSAVYPPFVWMPAYILSETMYTVLALTACLLFWRVIDAVPAGRPASTRALRQGAAAGAITGFAALTRPEMLLIAALLCAFLLVTRRVYVVAVVTVAMVAAIGPWTAYNSLRHDRFVLISNRGGPTFWMGHNAWSPGDGDAGASPEMRTEYRRIFDANDHLPPAELERTFYAEALTFVRDQPGAWLMNEVRKVFYFWIPIGPSYSSHSTVYWVSQAVPFVLLTLCALAGVRHMQPAPRFPVVLWIMAAGTFLTALVFFPLPRFRVPLFDPVLVVYASVWLSQHRWVDRLISSSIRLNQRPDFVNISGHSSA